MPLTGQWYRPRTALDQSRASGASGSAVLMCSSGSAVAVRSRASMAGLTIVGAVGTSLGLAFLIAFPLGSPFNPRQRLRPLLTPPAGIGGTATETERGVPMAIASAVQRGSWVYAYDERGRQLAMVPAGTGPEDGLKGYTATTVSVRRGSWIYVHDERGRQVSMVPAR